MDAADNVSKIRLNRNTRFHYKPRASSDEELRDDRLKEIYDAVINSEFFRLAHGSPSDHHLDKVSFAKTDTGDWITLDFYKREFVFITKNVELGTITAVS